MKQVVLAIFILLLIPIFSVAQKFDLGSWTVLNFKYNFDNKWSVFAETQVRSLKFYHNFHYFEYKGGVNYKVHKNVALTVGLGNYQTYKEGGNFVLPKNNNEFRIWPQIIISHSIAKLKIEHRYRVEFRLTSNGYRNRFRYRLGLAYPFGKQKNSYQPFLISASNELFFTDKEPYFERNRVLVAFNYKPTKSITLQVGYLHQFDYRINDETGRDFLQIGFFIELYRKQNKSTNYEIDLKDN